MGSKIQGNNDVITTSGALNTTGVHEKAGRTVRPKLLFLAGYFPPAQAIASIRAWNIAKYLARLGWDVTVVTPDPSVWRHVEDPAKVSAELALEGIRRVTTGHRWRCLIPEHLNCRNEGIGWFLGGLCRKVGRAFCVDTGIGWIKEAERACSALRTQDVDVILATGNPFASFTLARSMSQKLRRPYVLDYRDAWTVPQYDKPLRKKVCALEAELVASASAVTIISKSLLRNRLSQPAHVVTNGFDPEEMVQVKPHDFQHFAIVYAGTFHPPKIVITPVMQALRLLKERPLAQGMTWRFHYYGPEEHHVLTEAEREGVSDRVIVHGRVSRQEALSAVRGSGVTVAITSVIEESAAADKGIVTGKLFDALGLQVPVLLIGHCGSDVEAIIETSGAARLVTAKNLDGMVSFFQDLMAGEIPKARFPEAFAWPNIIRKLDTILRTSVAGNCQSRH